MQKTQRKETKKTNQKKKNNRIKNKSKFWKWINYVKKTKADKRIPKRQILKLNQKQKPINTWKAN